MKVLMYCMYDKVAQCAMPPFCARNDAEALRFYDSQFQTIFKKDPNSQIDSKDFSLLHLGYFDDTPVALVGNDKVKCVSDDYVFSPKVGS